jgi:hypothetical protein
VRLPNGRSVLLTFREGIPLVGGVTNYTVGVPNRLRPDDFLIMLLDDADLVVPGSVLLEEADFGSRSGDGRPTPIFHRTQKNQFTVQFGRNGPMHSLDRYWDAYGLVR